MHGWRSYIAIGDSFTEGLNDPGPDGHFRGWADRLAELLAKDRPGLRYANLAIRGKYLRQVLAEQLPTALAAKADLVTFAAGGNDILRPGGDPDRLAAAFEQAVVQLRAAGADVVIFTGFDTRTTPVLRHVRGRIATYNAHLWAIADRHGCRMVDLWSMSALHNPQALSDDRLHLTPDGHRRVALRTAEVLGIPVDADWREPWPAMREPAWLDRRRADLRWTREHFVPWLARHLRGRSSGDGMPPKRPELAPVATEPMATGPVAGD
ncbi:MAG TPA: SGNH/GDSL hydrolase family protein [Pseudonocardiaceae bacterium]|nr:SGNH/GDSL hydrolase family protein [Pseudonocardiaceae bacterium]